MIFDTTLDPTRLAAVRALGLRGDQPLDNAFDALVSKGLWPYPADRLAEALPRVGTDATPHLGRLTTMGLLAALPPATLQRVTELVAHAEQGLVEPGRIPTGRVRWLALPANRTVDPRRTVFRYLPAGPSLLHPTRVGLPMYEKDALLFVGCDHRTYAALQSDGTWFRSARLWNSDGQPLPPTPRQSRQWGLFDHMIPSDFEAPPAPDAYVGVSYEPVQVLTAARFAVHRIAKDAIELAVRLEGPPIVRGLDPVPAALPAP